MAVVSQTNHRGVNRMSAHLIQLRDYLVANPELVAGQIQNLIDNATPATTVVLYVDMEDPEFILIGDAERFGLGTLGFMVGHSAIFHMRLGERRVQCITRNQDLKFGPFGITPATVFDAVLEDLATLSIAAMEVPETIASDSRLRWMDLALIPMDELFDRCPNLLGRLGDLFPNFATAWVKPFSEFYLCHNDRIDSLCSDRGEGFDGLVTYLSVASRELVKSRKGLGIEGELNLDHLEHLVPAMDLLVRFPELQHEVLFMSLVVVELLGKRCSRDHERIESLLESGVLSPDAFKVDSEMGSIKFVERVMERLPRFRFVVRDRDILRAAKKEANLVETKFHSAITTMWVQTCPLTVLAIVRGQM